MNIGAHIRSLRKARGITQEEVARRAGMSLNGMADIERGDAVDPHISTLRRIAEALDTSVAELMGEPVAPLGEAPAEESGPPVPIEIVSAEALVARHKELETEIEELAEKLGDHPMPAKLAQLYGAEPRTWLPEEKRDRQRYFDARRELAQVRYRLETEAEFEAHGPHVRKT